LARATGPYDLRKRELPDQPPTSADTPVFVEEGIGRRQNVFRVPQEPHGSCGSLVDPLVPELVERPWGAGPMRHGSPRRLGEKRGRGRCGRESVPRLGDDGLRRGARESWDHGRGTRTRRLKRLSDEGSGRPRARKSSRTARAGAGTTQRTRRRVTASASERTFEQKPQERQRAQRARETGRREPSRERETPRTDRGGRGNPAHYGFLRSTSLEGRETPGGAIRSVQDR